MCVCYHQPLCHCLICVYGCLLSSFLMSLFDLCVWVSVIIIPYVIVWSVCMCVCYHHPLCHCLVCVYGCPLSSSLMSLFDLCVWVSVIIIPYAVFFLRPVHRYIVPCFPHVCTGFPPSSQKSSLLTNCVCGLNQGTKQPFNL